MTYDKIGHFCYAILLSKAHYEKTDNDRPDLFFGTTTALRQRPDTSPYALLGFWRGNLGKIKSFVNQGEKLS